MTTKATYCNTCCPEQSDVTISTVTLDVDEIEFDLDLSPEVLNARTITFQATVANRLRIRLWLTDGADPNVPSGTVPDGETSVFWEVQTDATGLYTKTITHAAGAKTWQVWATVLGVVPAATPAPFV